MKDTDEARRERLTDLIRANYQMQYAQEQSERQLSFYKRMAVYSKAEQAKLYQTIYQQKQQIYTLETRLAQFVQQAGLEAVFQHYMRLEKQIEAQKQQLARYAAEAAELYKQIKITANALLLKEAELIPDRKTTKEILKNSLLRTIAALKDEADGLDAMCQERQHRIASLEEQLSVIQAENEQLYLESMQQHETNQKLIEDNVQLQRNCEKASATAYQQKVQLYSLTKTNSTLLQETQLIPQLRQQAERAILADELEKQLKIKQKNFDVLSYTCARLQQEITEKTSHYERAESEFKLFQTQFSDQKFSDIMAENEKLKAENDYLKAQKSSLQKALVVATRARVYAAE